MYPHDLFTRLMVREGGQAPVTLLREDQLKALWDGLNTIRDVPGVLVETGVMYGGASIVMARANIDFLGERDHWMYDSWAGFPEDGNLTYGRKPETIDQKMGPGDLKSDLDICKQNFRDYGVALPNQYFVEGWFCDTTAGWDEEIALLRLDGDLYSSTLEVLENMYPYLNPGGVCIIDDYLFDGCRMAVHEYRDAHGITEEIMNPDGSVPAEEVAGAWWVKRG